MGFACRFFCTLLALHILLSGCATNPVTGKRQLQLYTEREELTLDADLTPLQIAADHGSFNDPLLADYITSVGQRLIPFTHRPGLPYRFILTNDPIPNTTALPGGTLLITRGLLAQLQNEAQLAALLAHELAHINARDANARLVTHSPPPDSSSSIWDNLTAATGASLPARHTREQERLADTSALAYLTAAGYAPGALPDLLDLLARLGESPWATAHPLTPEHLAELRARIPTNAPAHFGEPEFRQATLILRSQKPALLTLAQAQTALRDKNPQRAKTLAEQTLRLLPNDYTALLTMANALNALGQIDESRYYARLATSVHPDAPGLLLTFAQSDITDQNYRAALTRLDAYAALLPRNTHIAFFQGLCHEALNQIPAAALAFTRFLRGPSGTPSQEDYARRRLATWSRERKIQ